MSRANAKKVVLFKLLIVVLSFGLLVVTWQMA